MGQDGKWIVVANEDGPFRRTEFVPAKPRGQSSHKPKDPAKETVKRRLIEAVAVARRLLRDPDPNIRRLDAKCACEVLVRLAEGAPGRRHGVADFEIDRMMEALDWLNAYVDCVVTRHLILEWARGLPWAELLASDPERRSKMTLWRLFERSFGLIVRGVGEKLRA